MKHLLLLLSVVFAGSISAQTLQKVNANIQMPAKSYSLNGNSSQAKSAACGPDTNGYALAKASGLNALNINNSTSASAGCQYYDAPQPLTISGVSFYAWKEDLTNGSTMNAVVSIYAAGLDSVPTGSPLVSTTVVIDTAFGGGNLDVLRKTATFANPITVSSAYVIVVSNPSATPASMVFNDWEVSDGADEWLSSALLFGNWVRSYDLVVGAFPFNADCLFEPHVSYDLTASFLVDDPCFSVSNTLGFTNTSSPILNNRMYNIAAFQAIPEYSFTWNFGDGSPVENVIDATHAYGSAGAYSVSLSDTVYGWTATCGTDTIVELGTLPVAAFSSAEVSLTSTFTNSSTVGTGATYLWEFGDGSTSTLENPSHTYSSAGTYNACLTVIGACGSDQICSNITVVCAAPAPEYTFVSTGLSVTFTSTAVAGTGAVYFWDLGDGNTSTLENPTHTYAADGTYTVCFAVSDACGADSTCHSVTVTSCVNPVAAFDVTGTSPTFTFNNTSTSTGTATYTWDFGDGIGTSSDMSPSYTYTSNGTFTVSLIVTDSCGMHVLDGTVTVSGVGIDELSLIDVAVYPNPSNGVFTIEASENMETAYVTDLAGKLIYSGDLSGNKAAINAVNFANGTYFLSVRFANDLIQTVRLEVVK